MKKIICALISILLVLSLCSCTPNPDSPGSGEATTAKGPDDTGNPDPDTQVYESVLDEVYDITLRGYWGDKSFLDEDHDDLGGVCECAQYGDMLDEIGYLYEDLDSDGTPELIIAVQEGGEENEFNPGTRILAIYDCNENGAYCALSGWYRNAWYMLSDGMLYALGSSGAASSFCATYNYGESGTECEETYFTASIDDNGNWGYFYTEGENPDFDIDNADEVGEDDFELFTNACSQAEEVLELTAIARWGFPEIDVQLAEDADIPDDILELVIEESDYQSQVVLTPAEPVDNFKFLGLTMVDYTEEYGAAYETEDKDGFDTLDEPVLITFCVYGDMPNNGFSFNDRFGNRIRYILDFSGYDGAVMLTRF